MKKTSTTLAALIMAVSLAQSSVIVQWGNTDGAAVNPTPNETAIVTGNKNFTKTQTYVEGTAINPAVGANYYPSAAGRTPIFNAAGSMTRGAGPENLQTSQIQNNASHDRIRMIAVDNGTASDLTAAEMMVAWESANWLTSDNELQTLSHVGFRNNQGTTDFRFIVQLSDNSWVASTAQAWTGGSTSQGDFFITDAAAENWYAFTPVTSGTATVGALTTASMVGVKSVGFYFSGTDAGATNMGFQTGYFQATAIPEPATLGLVTAFGAAVLFIRRQFMI